MNYSGDPLNTYSKYFLAGFLDHRAGKPKALFGDFLVEKPPDRAHVLPHGYTDMKCGRKKQETDISSHTEEVST